MFIFQESCSSDEECYIPAEEVQEFKAKQRNVTEQRQQLRQKLQKRFAQMCINRPHIRPLHDSQQWIKFIYTLNLVTILSYIERRFCIGILVNIFEFTMIPSHLVDETGIDDFDKI